MADSVAKPALDILPGREGPALSAVSDMPVVNPAEIPVAETRAAEPEPVAEPAAKAEAKPENTDPADPAADPAVEAVAKPTKEDKTEAAIKGEITKERNRRRAAEEAKQVAETRADQAAKERAEALEALAALTRKPNPEPEADPRPARTAFDDPDKYDAALVEWSARQATATATAKAQAEHLEAEQAKETARAEAEQKAAQDAVVAEWSAKREAALEKYPDYAEVAEADGLEISLPMTVAIINAKDGADIVYHLGKNPEEAKRIASLTIPDGKGGVMPNAPLQVFELGLLAAELRRPKPVSKAPPPITPLGSRERAGEKSATEMTMEEYAASGAVRARLAADRSAGGRIAH